MGGEESKRILLHEINIICFFNTAKSENSYSGHVLGITDYDDERGLFGSIAAADAVLSSYYLSYRTGTRVMK